MRDSKRPHWPVLTLLTLLMLSASGCAHQEAAPPAPTESASELSDGMLTVIVFPVVDEPFIAPNLDAGPFPVRGSAKHFSGIDIDIMAKFAESIGIEVEFLRLDDPGFGALIPALVAGKGDAVASALTITDERDALVDFSRPYFTVATVVVTRRDAGIEQIADLQGKVGVGVRGSRPVEVLRGHGITSEIQEADFQTGAYAEVSDGNVDFAVMESASARAAVASRPNLTIALTFPESEEYGFAIAEGSRLKPLLDRFLAELEANGGLERIVANHLGNAPSAP